MYMINYKKFECNFDSLDAHKFRYSSSCNQSVPEEDPQGQKQLMINIRHCININTAAVV